MLKFGRLQQEFLGVGEGGGSDVRVLPGAAVDEDDPEAGMVAGSGGPWYAEFESVEFGSVRILDIVLVLRPLFRRRHIGCLMIWLEETVVRDGSSRLGLTCK